MNRTICVAIAEIVEGGTKQEFYADLRKSLDLSRRAANRAVSACLAIDQGLMVGDKCPKLYTYPVIAKDFPGVASIAASIARAVESKYKQERFAVSVGRKSVCHYRSFPWVLLSNKSSRTVILEDCSEWIEARIKLLGGWWVVRLAGGNRYRNQINGIRNAIESGQIGDSKIWTDRKHKAILGLSVQLPVTEPRKTGGVLSVVTMQDVFLSATKQLNDTPFTITGDDVKKWVSARDRRYQKLRQDRKSGKTRQSLSIVLRRVGDKWKRRMDSWTHEVTAKIVGHAIRRKCDTIQLDMTIKSFLPSFPYFEFAAKLAYKCEGAGVVFVNATQTIKEPDILKPHVYFKFSPSTGRVKIGETTRSDGGRHGGETDSAEELTILAIDNQPKNKTRQREKHYHALFADHREKGEWFRGEPVIHFLRATGWLGNAGNLSQIAQVLPLQEFAAEPAFSGPECERAIGNDSMECSQRRLTGEDITEVIGTALATSNS